MTKETKTGDVFEQDIHSDYLQIFKQAGVSMPVLDLGDRMGHTGYIDFIDAKEMNHEVS